MRELVINKNDAGQRLDKFLNKAVPALPFSMMYKSIRLKKIKVNRKRTEQNYILQPGDVVQLFIHEDFFLSPESSSDQSVYRRIKPKLNILYEDDNIMLLNKRPGVLVHEDDAANENTLIMHIKAYLVQKGEYNPEEEQSFAPALCNRIDRNTGGIVIAAKNAETLRAMNELIRDDDLSKFYICAVHGRMPKREDTLTAWLIKDEKNNKVSIFDEERRGSKKIITKYRVIANSHDASLLEIELITGRTHQIRAHMSHLGHPLLGDGKYGINREDRESGYKYQALYAYRLQIHSQYHQTEHTLDYLKGKVFQIPLEDIWFMKNFNV